MPVAHVIAMYCHCYRGTVAKNGTRWRRPPLNKSQWPLKPGSNPERKEQLYVLLTVHLDIIV